MVRGSRRGGPRRRSWSRMGRQLVQSRCGVAWVFLIQSRRLVWSGSRTRSLLLLSHGETSLTGFVWLRRLQPVMMYSTRHDSTMLRFGLRMQRPELLLIGRPWLLILLRRGISVCSKCLALVTVVMPNVNRLIVVLTEQLGRLLVRWGVLP